MIVKRILTVSLYFLLLMPFIAAAQLPYSAIVYDQKSKLAVPFATIKFGNSAQGMVADLDGKFRLPDNFPKDAGLFIEISSLGFKSQKVTLAATSSREHIIYLEPDENSLSEVVIKPPYDKIRYILRNAIGHKNQNNPDKYDQYRCHVYYKMLADVDLPDSMRKDTSKDAREIFEFTDSQHLLMSETYSIRSWQRPQQLQEDVLASRFSGLKKSMFSSLITDIVPFHSYTDYLTMNGKDYHNPVSRGFEQYYSFDLRDEIVQGDDTVWVLGFKPRGQRSNELTGTVYINSDGFAISHIIARANDTMLKFNVRIEQEYSQVRLNDTEQRWFPKHLNYIIDWQQPSKKTPFILHMKGTSRIDSVTWQVPEGFKFDKTHTVRLEKNAAERNDSNWQALRPDTLDKKEQKTYRVIDSLGNMVHADRIMEFCSKLPEGKVPLGPVDLDLKRLYSYNYYEGARLGLGLQTNEKLLKKYSLGGWAGYGFGDKRWKYGVFAEYYADQYKEFVVRAGYTDEINDPGRVKLWPELDKNYLNSYLLRRVDETQTLSLSVKKKINYWSVELAGRQQTIIPQYAYALWDGDSLYSRFNANEIALSFRYAYAERTAPLFGLYYSLGSKYPVWYGKVTNGLLQTGNRDIAYTQVLTAVSWQKHINRIGNEHFFVEAGKSWSDHTLPMSKLFAGNGYKYDAKGNLDASIYAFGGLMTIYPYEYYSDAFVSCIFRHDFDWKLYKLQSRNSVFSSAPNVCLQYDMLYGKLANMAAQKFAAFSVPDNAYHEGGVVLNSLLRMRYFNVAYITLNVGYFYHLYPYPTIDLMKNGRIVYGLGFEL